MLNFYGYEHSKTFQIENNVSFLSGIYLRGYKFIEHSNIHKIHDQGDGSNQHFSALEFILLHVLTNNCYFPSFSVKSFKWENGSNMTVQLNLISHD
jgi:hypothetical protein